MAKSHFNIIIFIGRPGSGKSEIIDYLQHTINDKRKSRFYIADMDVIDDFPMLWAWFEEDAILSNELGKPRIYTDKKGYFIHNYYWNLLIRRINMEYQKRLKDDKTYHEHTTTIIEFSRGSEHGGYKEAFNHLSPEILNQASIVYVDVPYQESQRKNRKRANKNRPHSILEHSLPDRKLERLYRDDDWSEFIGNEKKTILIKGIELPFIIFENEDDVTTASPELLEERLKNKLDSLWRIGRL